LLVGVAVGVGTIRLVQVRSEGTVEGFRPTTRSNAGGGSTSSAEPPVLPTGRCAGEPCNYLLLGSDSRAGLPAARYGTDEQIGGEHRADTIMLVHTDPRLEEAIVLSFPRDLWVEIPGRGFDKINSAFEGGVEGGGPQMMAQTVSDLTGLPIDHYLFVDLDGFRDVVDVIGGIELCIPAYQVNTPGWLDATTPDGEATRVYDDSVGRIVDINAGLDVEPGCQHLAGSQALAYVRARHLPCDSIPDFARIGRQQQFLRALINQMLEPAQFARAPALVGPILRNLRRDEAFEPGDLIYLVGQLRGLATGAVEFRTVPGVAGWAGPKSIVEMDASANALFDAILDGRPINDVGRQLVSTAPSEAVTTVAVIDDGAGGIAAEVEDVLSKAGFEIAPAIWDASKTPRGVKGPAIVVRPGDDEYARVVSAYFPGVRVVESADLKGVKVAMLVPAGFDPNPEALSGGGPAECPNGIP
jgi:LCP family protein required for cell wall assembly